jgi:hypothetical protein
MITDWLLDVNLFSIRYCHHRCEKMMTWKCACMPRIGFTLCCVSCSLILTFLLEFWRTISIGRQPNAINETSFLRYVPFFRSKRRIYMLKLYFRKITDIWCWTTLKYSYHDMIWSIVSSSSSSLLNADEV